MEEFIYLVTLMRNAQKDFFKYKETSDLDLSRKLEKSVDEWLSAYQNKQLRLDM